jgi:hypothetical protein
MKDENRELRAQGRPPLHARARKKRVFGVFFVSGTSPVSQVAAGEETCEGIARACTG